MTLISVSKDGDLREWIDRLHQNDASERDIEVPWAQAAINECRGTWMDVGYARTEPSYWKGVNFRGTRSVGLDFAIPDRPCPFDETIHADVVNYEFTEMFDLITCVSTLEHIGCDNTKYKAGATRHLHPIELQREVVKKLREASKKLLISVPFGMYEDHGWFLQYDLMMVAALEPTQQKFVALGGQETHPLELADCLYRNDEMRASAVALMEFS